jgi:hypothetical protein
MQTGGYVEVFDAFSVFLGAGFLSFFFFFFFILLFKDQPFHVAES